MAAEVGTLQQRKISFPVEALFQSAIQDNDNHELYRILSSHRKELTLDHTNHVGLTPLHQAVLNNNLDGVKVLLHFNSSVNIPDINGYTPLHTASALGFIQIISLLLIFGADIFKKTLEGDLPVDLAKDTTTSRLLQEQMVACVHRDLYWRSWILHKAYYWISQLVKFILWISVVVSRSCAEHWEMYRQRKSRTRAVEEKTSKED